MLGLDCCWHLASELSQPYIGMDHGIPWPTARHLFGAPYPMIWLTKGVLCSVFDASLGVLARSFGCHWMWLICVASKLFDGDHFNHFVRLSNLFGFDLV